LKRLASGDGAYYEKQRRQRLAQALDGLRRAAMEQPKLLVESPTAAVNQEFANLPHGVSVSPGAISITFSSPSEALQKLLALAMAIGNDFNQFEQMARIDP
jgi:hypothetical protein